MKPPVTIALFVTFLLISSHVHACKCPAQSIDSEVEKAFDIVIGKVTAEKNQWVSCLYSERGKEYEFATSYTYTFETEFSYKGKLRGIQVIRGGKGKGDCGAIFEVEKAYVIVVRKCNKGLYATLCSDNAVLSEATSQINFLNAYFGKDYKLESRNNTEMVKLLTIVAVVAFILIVFGFYSSRLKRKL